MQKKEWILNELRKRGFRITNQRKLVIDIILEEDCTCCKDIYYQAAKKDSSIGIATVYRMLRMLEEIGAIDRKNLFQISCDNMCQPSKPGEVLFLEEGKTSKVEAGEWLVLLKQMLRENGFINNDEISIVIKKEENCEVKVDDRLCHWNQCSCNSSRNYRASI